MKKSKCNTLAASSYRKHGKTRWPCYRALISYSGWTYNCRIFESLKKKLPRNRKEKKESCVLLSCVAKILYSFLLQIDVEFTEDIILKRLDFEGLEFV